MQDERFDQTEDLTLQSIIKIVAKWHPSYKGSNPIELIQMEFRSLKDVLGRAKNDEWDSLRRKLTRTEDISFQLIQQSQNFMNQLDQTLMATERQCSKRMERIQRDSLHRDIKIRSILDEQILKIVEENRILELGEQEVKPFIEACASIQQKLREERKKDHELMLSCRLEIEDFKVSSARRFKQIKRNHEIKMAGFKQGLKQVESKYLARIQEMKRKREHLEFRLIQSIQINLGIL